MSKVENILEEFCVGEQTTDTLLTTIEHLIKHDGIQPELIVSELGKEKYEALLTPNVIHAIERRIRAASCTIDGQHGQHSEEFDDTIYYDDIQVETDTPSGPSQQCLDKASIAYQEQNTKFPSESNMCIGNTGTENLGLTLNERYELVARIGSGGMGAVYKAIDHKLLRAGFKNPNVAIKILDRPFRARKYELQSLQQEVKRWQTLNHPNIAEVFNASQDGAFTYLTVEYLYGQSLKEKMAVKGFSGYPLQEAFSHIRAMGKALAFAHESGIVHSDFRPSNVIITEDGQLKVLDFGIARAMNESKVGDGATPVAMAITPAYASPERLERGFSDPRDDIYAFACTAYELLTGNHPFGGRQATEAMAMGLQPIPPQELSSTQWYALEQALEFDCNKRTNNLAMLVEDMTRHEALWPSHSLFIRGIAASIVLSVSVTGMYLANARQNSDAILDSSPIPLKSSATSTAQTPPLPDRNPISGRDEITNATDDSEDFASLQELTEQNGAENDSETDTQGSKPSPTLSSFDPTTRAGQKIQRLEQSHQNNVTPELIRKSNDDSSLTPVRRDYIPEQIIRETRGAASARHLSKPASEISPALELQREKSESDERELQAAKLATLHMEDPITRATDFEHNRITPPLASPTLFLSIVSKGDAHGVQTALDSGISAGTRTRSSGINALMLAATNGHSDIVESLLRANADINAQDKQLRTALIWAAEKGQIKIVTQLLDHGAKLNLRDKNGETALIHATWAGHNAVALRLVEKGAKLDTRDKQGFTALTVAAIKGHTTIARSLLNSGADPNLVARNGKTALMAAAWNGHADVVRLLTAGDSQLDTASPTGWTALINAAWNGHATIVKDLVKAGADPTIKAENQMSAIHAAEAQGFMEIADFLNKIGEN